MLRPVRVEIGPGSGELLLSGADARPEMNHLGIERSISRAARLHSRIEACRLGNARVVAADARLWVPLLPHACVDSYVIQFPDPWWKRRHRRRRVITRELVSAMVRSLVRDGTIELVTDVQEYFDSVQELFSERRELEPAVPQAQQDELRTAFARKAQRSGSRIWKSIHRRG